MKRIYIYIVLPLILVLFACTEDNGNYDYREVNEITISGINVEEGYHVFMGDELVIDPEIEQSLEDGNLAYEWAIDGQKVISTDKQLRISVTEDVFSYGETRLVFTVTDKSTSIDLLTQQLVFVTVTSNFSRGYYFLCANESNETVLSYFSTKYSSKDKGYLPEAKFEHVNYIEDALGNKHSLGKDPKMILATPYHVANQYLSKLHILCTDAPYKYLQLDNCFFELTSYANDETFLDKNAGYTFEPDRFIPDFRNTFSPSAFLSKGQIILLQGLLNRPAKHQKEYYWEDAYRVEYYPNFTELFAFDRLSAKMYMVWANKTNSSEGIVGDMYAFDKVTDFLNAPSLKGKVIAGQFGGGLTPSKGTGVTNIIYNGICLCVASPEGLELQYYFSPHETLRDRAQPMFDGPQSKTLNSNLFDENTKAVYLSDMWLVIDKNNDVYRVTASSSSLGKIYASIPKECGAVTAVGMSTKQSTMIVATYNESSTAKHKGSVIFIDKDSGKTYVYKNVIDRCVSLDGANSHSYFDYGDGR